MSPSSSRTSTIGRKNPLQHAPSLRHAVPEVNCGLRWFSGSGASSTCDPARGSGSCFRSCTSPSLSASFLLAQADPQRPVPSAIRRVRARLRLRGGAARRCRCSCRSMRGSRHGSARARSTVGTLVFFSSQRLLFWYAFRFHADAIAVNGTLGVAPAWRFLRLGELLRRDCAGAGVELRQLAVRHAPGAAAVRADRGRRVARRSIGGGLLARVPGRPGRRHGQHDARARRR